MSPLPQAPAIAARLLALLGAPAARKVAAVLAVAALGTGAVAYEALSPPHDAARPDPRPAPVRAVAGSVPATADAGDEVLRHTGGQECTVCHVTEHPDRQPCVKCHRPGTDWSVRHPSDDRCGECHETPKDHYPVACGTCHSPGKAFTTAAYPHSGVKTCAGCHSPRHEKRGECSRCHRPGDWRPTSGAVDHRRVADCTACHRPGHRDRGSRCASCHRPGVSWSFRHPASARCADCHSAPARHYGKTCSGCHSPAKRWSSARIEHSNTMRCQDCHRAGHRDRGSCTSCHRAGESWAFRHPASARCADCHRAPSSHYGTTCASCHSPSADWSSAGFSHPRVPGGEHTYRSFACSSCHPSGPPATDCETCHRENGEDEDDD